jgi:hypothetical protein
MTYGHETRDTKKAVRERIKRRILTQRRGHHEDVSNSGLINCQILEERLVPLLLGEVGPNSPQVDEDSKAL